jgi:hypothetical protein
MGETLPRARRRLHEPMRLPALRERSAVAGPRDRCSARDTRSRASQDFSVLSIFSSTSPRKSVRDTSAARAGAGAGAGAAAGAGASAAAGADRSSRRPSVSPPPVSGRAISVISGRARSGVSLAGAGAGCMARGAADVFVALSSRSAPGPPAPWPAGGRRRGAPGASRRGRPGRPRPAARAYAASSGGAGARATCRG